MEVSDSLTSGHFVVNLINTCIGIGILAQPFAFAISGIYAIVSMSMAFVLVTYAGYCITKVTIEVYKLDGEKTKVTKVTKPAGNENDIENEGYGPVHTDIDTDFDGTDIDEEDLSPMTASTTNLTPAGFDIETENVSDERETNITTKKGEYSKIPSTSISKIDPSTPKTPEKPEKNRSVYAEISYQALGKFGEIYGSFGMMFLFSTFLVNILVMNWELLLNIVHIYAPNFNPDFIYLFIIMLVIPLIFVLNWKQLTIVSTIGVLSVTLTTIIIFYLFVKSQIEFKETKGTITDDDYYEDHDDHEYDEQNMAKGSINNMNIIQLIFFSFVTFTNSISGSASIPMMAISSKNKKLSHFVKLIIISYLIVSGFYIIVGLSGKQIYGINTHVLILNNFFYWPANAIISILISSIMIINLCGSYGMFITIDCDIIEGYLNLKQEQKCKRILLRIVLWILTSLIGYFARHNLAFLIAIQGCVDSICGPALPMPFLLYLGIFWKKMSGFSKIIHILLFLFVVSCAIVTTIGAIDALL